EPRHPSVERADGCMTRLRKVGPDPDHQRSRPGNTRSDVGGPGRVLVGEGEPALETLDLSPLHLFANRDERLDPGHLDPVQPGPGSGRDQGPTHAGPRHASSLSIPTAVTRPGYARERATSPRLGHQT